MVETMTAKSPFEINWPLDDLYGQCGHWCNSVGSTYSIGWFFIEQLGLYIFLHVLQLVLRLCTLAIWSESAVKRRKKINCNSSNLIQLNLHETDLLVRYLSHHLAWHCSSIYEDLHTFERKSVQIFINPETIWCQMIV